MAEQKKSPQAGSSGHSNHHHNAHHNSTFSQRQRLIEGLKRCRGGLTTIEIRRYLDILMPAARIFELRDIG